MMLTLRPNLHLPSAPRAARALLVSAVLLFSGGCAGLLQSGTSNRAQIAGVMAAWSEGWSGLDRERLAPLLSEDYAGMFDENKLQLLGFVDRHKGKPGTRIQIDNRNLKVRVDGDTAEARRVKVKTTLHTGWSSDTVLDYLLQKEDGGQWRITGARVNPDFEESQKKSNS